MAKTFNVLIIDDDEDDQFLIQSAFEHSSAQHKLRFASEATDIVTTIQNDTFVPDLVLLDLNMPVINGFEVLKQLRSSLLYRHIPVVILTTSSNEADIMKAYELGANTYLTKPSNHSAWIAMVEQIRQYWFLLAKMPVYRVQ